MVLNIPTDLLSSAYRSENGEAAWDSPTALEVISWATASRLTVLGVEVWLPTTPGPTIPVPNIYTFETERRENERWELFLSRANAAATDYVKRFEWDAADTQHHNCVPYFNLTLEDREHLEVAKLAARI